MMDTSQLIEQSKEIFTDFKQVNDSLYKGNFPIDDKIAGIYYLNFNHVITEKDFEDIQYNYLAEEFYNQEDSLQWNIYLLFINSNISDELKVKILTDDKYARKLIFEEKEFIDYFELEKSNQTGFPDVITDWKKKLDSVELQEVYSETTYIRAIENFKNDKVPKIVKNKQILNTDSLPSIDKINDIYLQENFREFPKNQREFKFGAVNLITGSNGVGKTSLLESIELIITGKTQRNNDKDEDSNSIKATLNGNLEEIYDPKNGKYKSRGIKWYNRNQAERGNYCYKSFNQFNFFNTDAAHQFANAEHIEQINDSLKYIILGSEFSILKDRVNGFAERLKPELKKIIKEIEDTKSLLNKNNDRIKELKSDKNFEDLKKNISENISKIGYKAVKQESDYSIPNLYVNEIKTEINYILNNNWVTNYDKFLETKSNVEKRIKLVVSQKEIYALNNDIKIQLNQNQQLLETRLNKIFSFIKYFEIDNVNDIELLESAILKNKTQLSIVENLKKEYNLQINVVEFNSDIKSLKEKISEKQLKLNVQKDEIAELEKEIKGLNDNFSIVENLLNQIKLLGRDFLSHNRHSTNCPLCEQKISHIELSKKIEADFNRELDKSILSDKNIVLEKLKAELTSSKNETDRLVNFNIIAKKFLSNLDDLDSLTINKIDTKLQQILSSEVSLTKELDRLSSIQSQLAVLGGSVQEYKNLKEEISRFISSNSKIDKFYISTLRDEIKEKLDKNKIDIETKQLENSKLISELNKSLKLSQFENDFDKIEDIVNANETKINTINYSFDKLNTFIKIPSDKTIQELSSDLKLLEENLATYRQIENSQNEIKKLLTENEIIESRIPSNKELQLRLSKAVKILNELNSNSEDSILNDYFVKNLDEIKDIFKTIHSPQEFTDLKYKDSELILFKEKTEHTISEISTGQRAALVLSIFISLNRKLKEGPNILIFDDPVTFIDDFNALSFLDFLRYFIVKEKKQIFFATANKKFSALFKKKFEFLGDEEFKEFELTR